ncbi:MAG: hypothetical protein HY877_01095 [Deltaproteobacteria bacterium]|nr:hypothetical protein [Deltaproteobacteria bacterium]
MTVSEAKKYALVINGDTETRHLKNVASAVKVLQKEGYEVLVSPSKTYSDIQKTIQKLKDLLKGKSPSELVIYATGHGSLNKEDAQICFADGCNGDAMGILLDELPYQKRTFIMDQCYSGNWSRRFTNKSKTLFISLGSPNEKDTCHEFAPYFWSEDVLDANKDGILSWQERYAYALPHVQRSFPQFIMSPGYKQNGRAPFDSRVTHVADKQYLDRELEKLKQGQSAVVLFAASWCGACKEYKPHFENFAVEDNGQHLFLYTENESLADLYQVKAVPSLFVIQPSPTGVAEKKYHIRLIEDRENLPVEIAESVLSVKDRISLIREQIQNVDKRGQLNLLGQLRRIVPLASPEDLEQIDSFFRGFLESEDEKVRQSAVHLYAEVVTKIYEKNDAKLMTDLAKPELQSNISYFSFLLNKFFNEFFYNQPDAVF